MEPYQDQGIAVAMGVSIARVSQIEHGEVSSFEVIARYVEALVGRLDLVADFGDRAEPGEPGAAQPLEQAAPLRGTASGTPRRDLLWRGQPGTPAVTRFLPPSQSRRAQWLPLVLRCSYPPAVRACRSQRGRSA